MKTIIVPTGFTAASSNAVQFAVDMAVQIQSAVLLLHVYQLPVAISELPVSFETIDQVKQTAEDRLAALKKEIEATAPPGVVITTEARPGNIADELHLLCNAIHPFAVVMACSRAGKLERILFGSASLSAIHHLEVPVVLVPPEAKFQPVKRIGLAYDFDHYVDAPPQEIRAIVREFNAELHVLNVHQSAGHINENRLHTFLLHKTIADLHPQYHVIDRKNVEEGLKELVQQYQIDIMIIIPRRHPLLQAMFRTSHSDQMALQTNIPLMAIHHE